jgi:Domain of unknown function (DUF4136)
MNLRKMLAVPLFLIALTTAVFADNVKTDYDHSANFNQIKTYSWAKVETKNSIWNDRVKDAIDKQLAAKGWTQVPSGGNVSLVAIEKTSIQQQYDTFYDNLGGFRRFGGFGESTTSVDNYKVGTLMVNIFDGNSKQLIWRGTSSSDLSGNPDKNTNKLDKDVAKMFKNFPPKVNS